jgi:hypothetical protein
MRGKDNRYFRNKKISLQKNNQTGKIIAMRNALDDVLVVLPDDSLLNQVNLSKEACKLMIDIFKLSLYSTR